MAAATIVHDTSEAVALCPALGLYLKPITKLTITVAPPPSSSTPGRAVSNWEVMERLKALVAPAQAQFSALRLSRSAPDAVRFEGELERRALLRPCLALLDGQALKLPGFSEPLRVRAAESRPEFPSRHDWDAFFRDAADMDETRPGERPDTVRLEGLPCRWFAPRADPAAETPGAGGAPAGGGTSGAADRPSEELLCQAFGGFGDVRRVDIPMLDPYRGGEAAGRGFHTFGFGGRLHFEAYVQFREYAGFARAMAALRGMKLMLKGNDGKAVACAIKVSFDCTKHLSDASIRRRQLERQKLQELELKREEQKRREKEAEERQREEERKQKQLEEQERERRREEKLRRREQRQREREQRRGRRRVEKLQAEEQRRLQEKIRMEERKLLLAQRNLQSIRLVAELLSRAEAAKLQQRERSEERRRRQRQEERRRLQEAELRRVEEEKERALGLQRRERELRQRLLSLLLGRRPAARADPAPRADDLLRPVLDILHRATHARALSRDPDPKAHAEPAVLACIPENAPSKPGASPAREPPPPPPPRTRDDHDKCNREPEPPQDLDPKHEGRPHSRGGESGGGHRRGSPQEWQRQHQRRVHADGVDTAEEREGEEPRDPEQRERRRRREKDKDRGRERKRSRHGRHSRSRSRSPRRRSAWNR